MPSRPGAFPLLPRKRKSDKRDFGHVLAVSGSRQMSGAPQLLARACLTAGAGLVTVGIPKSVRTSFSKKALAEAMLLELPETVAGSLASGAYAKVLSFIRSRGVKVAAIGPGLTHDKNVSTLVRKLVAGIPVPMVLDADGLNAFKGKKAQLKKHRAPLVLTPHQGEFERLFEEKWPENKVTRTALAKKLSKFYDVTLVLKSHHTLVVDGDEVYENFTGNPGLAKAGSGDVLTGIVAAFLAQGLIPFRAACWAVYFHGRAGDMAAKVKSELGVLASDIIEYLPKAFLLE